MSAQPELVTKLRPIVQVTPTQHGLFARGWSQSLTLTGGTGLRRVWDALELRLVEGISDDHWCPQTAPGPVREAVERIRAELQAHDMLVRVPKDWAVDATGSQPPTTATRAWLESVADHPWEAWARLADHPFAVYGSGPVAWAAERALRQLDVAVEARPAPRALGRLIGVDGDPVAVAAGERLVWASADDSVGLVLPVVDGLTVGGSFAQLRERVGMSRRVSAPTALHSLVGAAAVHRLVCAVAGLNDPGQSRGARGQADAGWAAATVLVARMDPLRAAYHPWLAVPPCVERPVVWLQDASVRLGALTDPELGPAQDHDRDLIQQVPAAIHALRHGAQVVAGVAPTGELARVTAGTALVEDIAGERLERPIVAGADDVDAAGRALRRAWDDLPAAGQLPEETWAAHPAARRWWKALALHFAASPQLRVELLTDGVYRASASAPGFESVTAVEATAGDAAAMAALGLVGRIQWDHGAPRDGEHQIPATQVAIPTGASPSGREPGGPVGWDDDAWSWPSGLRVSETDFQHRLRQLPDGRSLELRAVLDPRVSDLSASHTLVEVRR